jgi:hypothetical protein
MAADLTILLTIAALAAAMFCTCVGCAIVNGDTVDVRQDPPKYTDVVSA